jgi:hypothetical protein
MPSDRRVVRAQGTVTSNNRRQIGVLVEHATFERLADMAHRRSISVAALIREVLPKALGGPISFAVVPTGSRVILPTGEIIEGAPIDSDDYRATARDLGYGEDTLAMCQEHDPLHARLCNWLGVESHALRHAAGLPHDARLATLEEAAVLAVQKFTRAMRA